MDRDTIKDWLREINEWVMLALPSVLMVMIILTFYIILTRGIK